MKNKRVILEMSEELHAKIKRYAVKDERSLNVVLRKILLVGVNTLNIEQEKLERQNNINLGNLTDNTEKSLEEHNISPEDFF